MHIKDIPKILMIGFDAAEFSLIKYYISEGELPVFSELIRKGEVKQLESTSEWLAGSPWPSFYTGTPPGEHGIYHNMQWNPTLMKRVNVTSDWINPKPFWRNFDDLKAVSIDVPMLFSVGQINGIELTSWASHDRVIPLSSYPIGISEQIVKNKEEINRLEEWGPSSLASLMKKNENLVYSIEKVKNFTIKLINQVKWNFFIVVFGATHTAGHKLWDVSSIWDENKNSEILSELILNVYRETDNALGEIIKAVDRYSLLCVFSLHGITNNNSKNTLLPSIMSKILGKNTFPSNTSRLIDWIPLRHKYTIYRSMPESFMSKILTSNYINQVSNWGKIKAFYLESDHQGYIRINLKGREKKGIVNPGKEYTNLLDDISKGLESFKENGSEEQLVKEMKCGTDLFSGDNVELLPDFLIKWSDTPTSKIDYVESQLYGRINWKTPTHSPDGRSGNHTNYGFMILDGDFKFFEDREKYSILDIAPSICSIFNKCIPSKMKRKPIIKLSEF
jgi:predicted AlkP superfamily phosphohydrolase/phosphomutase